MRNVIELRGVTKSYVTAVDAPCVCNLDLTVNEGDFMAIMGPSGQGKSTLLNIMSGLVSPDEGAVLYKGRSLADLTGREMDGLRCT